MKNLMTFGPNCHLKLCYLLEHYRNLRTGPNLKQSQIETLSLPWLFVHARSSLGERVCARCMLEQRCACAVRTWTAVCSRSVHAVGGYALSEGTQRRGAQHRCAWRGDARREVCP